VAFVGGRSSRSTACINTYTSYAQKQPSQTVLQLARADANRYPTSSNSSNRKSSSRRRSKASAKNTPSSSTSSDNKSKDRRINIKLRSKSKKQLNQDDNEDSRSDDDRRPNEQWDASTNTNVPYDSWLDKTTARILNYPSPYINTNSEKEENSSETQQQQLTSDDVNLITTLMTSHARRSTVSSAITCEYLLKRVVDEVNTINDSNTNGNANDNTGVRVTTKMYTVVMDAWAKSQRRPLPGSGNEEYIKKKKANRSRSSSFYSPYGFDNESTNKNKKRDLQRRDRRRRNNRRSKDANTQQQQQKLQLHPQHQEQRRKRGKRSNTNKEQQLPLGAAAQRAHRIHNKLVSTYKSTKDIHLAPSTISYNAAINAWSKSYHSSSGEMAELLLGEMIREWRYGIEDLVVEDDGRLDDGETDEVEDDVSDENGSGSAANDSGVDMDKFKENKIKAGVPYFREDRKVENFKVVDDNNSTSPLKKKRGNDRVKPDVVTFTAVIDAWVKCTALAHDYHYEQQPNNQNQQSDNNNDPSSNVKAYNNTKYGKESYVEWKKSQAAKADELTARAAERAKQLLGLMITLGHYDPERHDTQNGNSGKSGTIVNEELPEEEQDLLSLPNCEPGMRPNCYTYSAVMNALAKSCSALRVMTDSSSNDYNKGKSTSRRSSSSSSRDSHSSGYDPAKEAQDMLEDMIIKYNRYKERVGENGIWKSNSATVGYGYEGDESDGYMAPKEDREENEEEEKGYKQVSSKYEEWMKGSWSSATMEDSATEDDISSDDKNLTLEIKEEEAESEANSDPNWYEPRLNELTFPPNTINYNSVLNAWSRASRYNPYAAYNAQEILFNRMEKSSSDGGDDVEPDALSYSLVIHGWLRGCRGNDGSSKKNNRRSSSSPSPSSSRHNRMLLTDRERIEQAMVVVDRLEAWARRKHERSHNSATSGDSSGGGARRIDESSDEADMLDLDDDLPQPTTGRTSYNAYRQHNKARDLDVEVYNSVLVAYSREKSGDHAASVMRILDRMESLADELDMPSVRPNMRSYNIALGVISNSATMHVTSLADYYKDINGRKVDTDKGEKKNQSKKSDPRAVLEQKNMTNTDSKYQRPPNPLYAGQAAESILGRMLARKYRPDAYTFASVLNTYQRIPNGKLDAALAADAVVRGMESLYLHGDIDESPDVFHYTMVCACWSRSGEQGVAGERCSEILSHMQERHENGYPRVKPNIRTFNAVIDSHAYNGRVAEAEDMLLSMVDNYESSAARSMDGIEDENLPIRPDSFSFNTVIQQWARSRTPEGGRRAEYVLDRMLKFHHAGNADVRPDERSFAYIIYHYTKGAGRMDPKSPDRALKLLRKMIGMYRQGYKELLPSHHYNKTNPIFAFTSVIDAHSVLRRPDSGVVGDELLVAMTKLGEKIDSLRPNTYACLSVLYGWSSCGSVDAGERAMELLQRMEDDMADAAERGEESILRTTQRCYILAQTAWARSPSEQKAEGALKVLNMMENTFAKGYIETKPTVQSYSMVLNACAFADTIQDENGRMIKTSLESQQRAFQIAKQTLKRIRKEPYRGVVPNPVIYGTFIKCCGRLDLPDKIKISSANKAFQECCQAGMVSDFVLTQLRYALRPEQFLDALVKNGYENLNRTGKSISRDGMRLRHIKINELPKEWTKNGFHHNKRSR